MKLVYTSVQVRTIDEDVSPTNSKEDLADSCNFHIDDDDDTFFDIVEHERWYHGKVVIRWLPPCILIALVTWWWWWSSTWFRLGGDAQDFFSGSKDFGSARVSLSADGTTLALGYPHWTNDTVAWNNTGRVQVWSYDSHQWKLQDDVQGSRPNRLFGYSVSLSGDGNLLAAADLGAQTILVRFRDENGNWYELQKAQDEEEKSLDIGTTAMALSQDGTRMVLGSTMVQVLEIVDQTWHQVGSNLESTTLEPKFAISADGSRIAVGSNEGVEIYELHADTNTWNTVGSIDSDSHIDSLAMSADGRLVAFSCSNVDKKKSAVRTQVMEDRGDGTWTSLGKPIDTIPGNDFAMAFSGDGNVLVVTEAKDVRVLRFMYGHWFRHGRKIAISSGSEVSLSVSYDGKRIAVASMDREDNEQVGVYELP